MSRTIITPIIFPADSADLRRYDTIPRPLIRVQISWLHTSGDGDDHGYRSERFESGPESVRQTATHLLRAPEEMPVWWTVGAATVHWRDLLTLLETDPSAFQVNWTHGAEWLLSVLRQCEYGDAVGIGLFRADGWTEPMELAKFAVRSSVYRSAPAVDFAAPLWLPGWATPARPVSAHLASLLRLRPTEEPVEMVTHTVTRTTELKGNSNRLQVWLESPQGFYRFEGQSIPGLVEVVSSAPQNGYRSVHEIRVPADVRVWIYEIEFRGDRRWIVAPDKAAHSFLRPAARMSAIPEAMRPFARHIFRDSPIPE